MIRKDLTILLLDTNWADAKDVASKLKACGHSVLTARDGAHAMSILEFRAVDVLIVDIAASIVAHVDLIDWAGCLCPKPRIVVTGENAPPGKEEALLSRGVDLFLEKPFAMDCLLQFLQCSNSRSSFSGTVEEVDIIEYCQFVILRGRKAILEVTSSAGTSGRIFLANGRPVHAVCGVLQGEAALYRCLAFKQGTFSDKPWTEPEKETINKPGEFLLMEAIRKRDEAWVAGHEESDKY
jgi:CheY-like chemotaxis protein